MIKLQPRMIRLRDAAAYCGMDKNRFNSEVRPHLIEIPIGAQGIAFDVLYLDRRCDQHKARNGRPGRAMKRGSSWGGKSRRGLIKRGDTWHIAKTICNQRIRERCQTGDLAEAERYLVRRMEEIRLAVAKKESSGCRL